MLRPDYLSLLRLSRLSGRSQATGLPFTAWCSRQSAQLPCRSHFIRLQGQFVLSERDFADRSPIPSLCTSYCISVFTSYKAMVKAMVPNRLYFYMLFTAVMHYCHYFTLILCRCTEQNKIPRKNQRAAAKRALLIFQN